MRTKLALLLVLAISFVNLQVVTVQAAQEEAEVAILYYAMADDRVIFGDGRRELIEAEKFAGNPKVKILLEISKWPDGDPNGSWLNWSSSQWGAWQQANPEEKERLRYAFTENDKNSREFVQPLAETLKEDEIGNVRDNVVNFLQWAHQNHRAKKYILIVGAHGSGSAWKIGNTDFTTLASGITGVSDPTESREDKVKSKVKNFLGNGAISSAVSNLVVSILNKVNPDGDVARENEDIADRLGVVAFDACLMQTVGVAYELAPTVDKLVACSISMIGMSFEQMIASVITNSTIRPSDLSNSNIDNILEEFNNKDDYKITNAQIANHLLNAMYEHGEREGGGMSYISSVSDVKLIEERKKSDDKDVAKMLARFADTFLEETADDTEKRNKYMMALHKASNKTQRYDMSFNMYGDLAHFFGHLRNDGDLPSGLRDLAKDIHFLTKAGNPDAADISENNKNLVARMRKKQGTQGFKLPEAEGLSILFPFYKVNALMRTPTVDGPDGPVEITSTSQIADWVQGKAQAGDLADVIAAAGQPADVRYEILRFEALKLNTAHKDGGKKWADLIKSYWEWAGANIPTADAPEVTLFRRVNDNIEEFGSVWNADLLSGGFGFNVGDIKGYFFQN